VEEQQDEQLREKCTIPAQGLPGLAAASRKETIRLCRTTVLYGTVGHKGGAMVEQNSWRNYGSSEASNPGWQLCSRTC